MSRATRILRESAFDIAKAAVAAAYAEHKAASDELNKIPGVNSGQFGLTPDHVKAMPEYRAARAKSAAAFAKVQKMNSWFTKSFKNELRAERRK